MIKYFKSKYIKIFICFIIVFVLLNISTLVNAVTTKSIVYYDNRSLTAYDIRGVVEGTSTDVIVPTTYANDGYWVYFKIGNNEQMLNYVPNGGTKTVDGVSLTLTATLSQDNKTMNVEYYIANNTMEEKQYSVATLADIQIGQNDRAAIYKEGNSLVQITQDNQNYENNYGTQFTMEFSPATTTTWIGNFELINDNRYTNGSVNSYTVADDEDTGLAFSWSGTLQPGGDVSYNASYTISEAPSGTVEFYKYDNITTPFQTKSVLVGGAIVIPELPTEDHYTFSWNTKTDGTGTKYEANKGIIATNGLMKLYEVRTPNKFTITYESNGGSDVDDSIVGYNEQIDIPDDPQKDGYVFGGWYSDEQLTNKYVFGKMPAESFTLYAKWNIEYKILEGANQTHIINDGKDIIVKANGEIDKLKGIMIDDNNVESKYYSVETGSTILTLKTDYLDTLSVGTHKLTI